MAVQNLLESLIQTAGIRLINSTELYPQLHQAGDAGLPLLLVENPLGRAVLALQGAHLLEFRAANAPEMLWISPKTLLEAGKPIRGGIPLCLPWFGPGPDGRSMHGFARTSAWELVEAEVMEDGAQQLVLELAGDASVSDLWPHDFVFRLQVTVGKALGLQLKVKNAGSTPMPLAFAFHTYFAVPDVAASRVTGLDGAQYIDKMDGFARKQQESDVRITDVTDRIYLSVAAKQTLHGPSQPVQICSDSQSAVVWNAWNNDKNIPDMGEGNHVGYLCVERGDVAEQAKSVAAGEEYVVNMMLSY